MDELLTLINLYRASHPLCGATILGQIEKLMPQDADVLKGSNCCTFRKLVSDLLFN